jgi:hypothetical protein
MKIATWGLLILVLAPAGTILGRQQAQQQQDDSLAAAARRAHEQKRLQGKAAKVWTNDDIPTNPGSVSIVGDASSQNTEAADTSANTANSDKPQGADSAQAKTVSLAEKKALLEADLAAAKENLQTLQNDLDILQRKFALDQQTYMSKPEYSSDKSGAAAIKDEQDQIDAKQQEMSEAQKKVADLQAQLNATTADGAGSSSNPPSKSSS